jgi:putative methionine-R-sulfoxide reductase with GAF domain
LGVLLAEPADAAPLARIVDELYRGLPHYTAIGIFETTTDGLVLEAGHGIDQEQALRMAEGLATTTVASGQPLLVPDITRDTRARPIADAIIAELVVPVLRDGAPYLVLDVQSDRYAALGRADLELLTWLAGRLQQSHPVQQ